MAISKHVKILTRAGVITVEREGRIHWCRVNLETMRQARDWIDYYRAASERLDADGS